MTLRGIAFVVGVALLGTTAHATIIATGGYGSAHSYVTIAIAAGVGVSALAVGAAWHGRRGLALGLLLAIVAGEAFGLISTAERLVVSREVAQAPLRTAAEDYAKAAKRVADAAAAVAALPATSARLKAATDKKDAADRAATEKSAERGCRENCRQLLQQQVEEAGREVTAARAELVEKATLYKRELDQSRAALAALKAPESATPLADRVGIAAWVLDLLAAALGSIAANGMACGLIAFAGHHRTAPAHQEAASAQQTAPIVQRETIDVTPEPKTDLSHDRRFALECIRAARSDGEATDIRAIRGAYLQWCEARGITPLPGKELANRLGVMFKGIGVPLEMRDGSIWAVGIRVEEPQQLLAAPR
jgi:hypothetical protein